MLIAVMGDTHHHQQYIKKAMKLLKDVDMIIHTGDHYGDLQAIVKEYGVKAIGVRGNCDHAGEFEIIEVIAGKRFFICHGHQYDVKRNINTIFYRGREVEADIVIFGHSHHPVFVMEEGMILLNPGSVSEPRGGSKRSMALIYLGGETKVEFIEID
ncbi:YfcE family phosphodiesterase [Alkaliphilus hydrothermalis]|uniref:Phosphoesterase n=1 Tax=Alkaliphilus hydrothermalis TaxID=1482730 RepID=A0ABS2NQH6_9FIRM|nr:metallophosphoesterase [Alkaliphilus hydrothermalis]MBM7615169.1 putative phosphoesterase [Alkaliphilus hydrothermalis]